MDDLAAIVERMRIRAVAESAEVAALPCGSCDFRSEQASKCRFNEKHEGCKHRLAAARHKDAEQKIRDRENNLLRAGLDRNMVADPNIQLVCRDQLEPRKAIDAVTRAYATPGLRFLVLGGPHRTGKTMALFYACATHRSARYIRSQQLGRIDQPHENWVAAGTLAINELGRENLGNGFTVSNLDEIMAEREYGNRLTIFATNLPLRPKDGGPSLVGRYGDLFASRIAPPIGAYVTCGDGVIESLPVRRHEFPREAEGS